MNKIEFSDSIYASSIKLFSTLSVLTTWIVGINIHIYTFLLERGLVVEYFYFGAIGQVVFTLMQLKGKLENQKDVSSFTKKSLFAMLIGWAVAPILSMLIVSGITSQYSLTFGIVAFALGGSLEKAWDFIRKQGDKHITEKEDETTK